MSYQVVVVDSDLFSYFYLFDNIINLLLTGFWHLESWVDWDEFTTCE